MIYTYLIIKKYIYIDEELKKNKFEECYYFKYYKYGNNFNGCCREDGMYKFIKHYKLINPI